MDPEALFGWTLFVLFVVVPVISAELRPELCRYLLGLGLMFLAGLTGFGSDAR